MGNLIFNGISTVDMGVQIQTPPVYEFPRRVYDTFKIEGRSGDLVIDRESYENVQRRYYLALGFRKGSTFITNAKMITEWLNSTKGYARLEDSYEPDYYRMALFNDPGEITNFYDQGTLFEISFDCKPQRFLKTGEIKQSYTQTQLNATEGIKIINPTKYIALPEIILTGSSGTKLEFRSGNTFSTANHISTITSIYTASHFKIDSELQDCYALDLNLNPTIYINNQITLTEGFPILYPGINWIKRIAGTITKFEITPRWWTL